MRFFVQASVWRFVMTASNWWRGGVIYQIYPRSFFDSNGDGIGDLPGVTARLDHVARLGVDAIWLCPFFASPQRDFGYDVSHYTEIDPLFGNIADFDALLGTSACAGAESADRPGLEPYIRPAHVVSGQPFKPDSGEGGLVCLGGLQRGWHAAEQLAFGVRRLRMDVGTQAAAVFSASFPWSSAGA